MSEKPLGNGPVTHWEGCWKDSGHWRCAQGYIDRLERQLAETEAQRDTILRALREENIMVSPIGPVATAFLGIPENVRKAAGEKP